ncbi:AAA family ATPase [bacterium]|nr:AAA family ATPase [bacterium]
MELVIFMGIQATGKSTFYRERFFTSHVRVNLDMLRTRHREALIVDACIAGKTPFVVDNTNLRRGDRQRYFAPAREAGFKVIGYFFQSRVVDALARNANRDRKARVPDLAIRSATAQLELPAPTEGFDKLYFVQIGQTNQFEVEEWKNEI